jgi:hypothetical protein
MRKYFKACTPRPYAPLVQVFFMKSIKSSPKPDVFASVVALCLAKIASNPLCFLALALFRLLEFVEDVVVVVVFGVDFTCKGEAWFAADKDIERDDPDLCLVGLTFRRCRVFLPQDPQMETIALACFDSPE